MSRLRLEDLEDELLLAQRGHRGHVQLLGHGLQLGDRLRLHGGDIHRLAALPRRDGRLVLGIALQVTGRRTPQVDARRFAPADRFGAPQVHAGRFGPRGIGSGGIGSGGIAHTLPGRSGDRRGARRIRGRWDGVRPPRQAGWRLLNALRVLGALTWYPSS
jgi:hypothetical protein